MPQEFRSACHLSKMLRKGFLLGSILLLLVGSNAFGQDVEPIPDFYKEPGLSPNRDYVNQQANEHIDPFNGKLQLHYVDLFIPGNGGLDIKIQRSYSSLGETLTEPTGTGVGWTMHFGRVLRRAPVAICASNIAPSNAPVIELPDGSRQMLYLSLDGTYSTTVNHWRADCAPGGLGMYITSPEGLRYEMTTPGTLQGAVGFTQQNSWYTTRIVDLNGNTLNFAYQILGKNLVPTTITASDGRLVTFSYSGNNLSTITNGTRTWTYTYTYLSNAPDYPFLAQVERPDGNKWQYTYNLAGADTTGGSLPAGTFSVASVTYPTGSTISYQYGFVTFNDDLPRNVVITQKQSEDFGGTWSFVYAPASEPGAVSQQSDGTLLMSFPFPAMLDITSVTGPDGTTIYRHFGANSAVSGFTFAIGFLMQKQYDNNIQVEGHSFAAQLVSNTQNIRPGGFQVIDNGIFSVLTTETDISKDTGFFETVYSNFDAFGNAQTVGEGGPGPVPGGAQSVRTTQYVYKTYPGLWVLHQPQSITVDNVPGTINYTYDTNANLLTSTRYGVATTYTYLASGDIATKQDALGHTTTYSDYMRGIPRSESQPEGVSIQRLVSADGNITSETDGEGVTTQYAYDGLNRLTSIVHPAGNPVSITWQTNERDVQRGAYVEKTVYDGYGREISVEHDGGTGVTPVVQTYKYDALNRKLFTSYPNQTAGEAVKYDMLGRPTVQLHVATPVTPGVYFNFGGQRSFTYGSNGITTIDELGRGTIRYFRGFGDPGKMALTQIDVMNDSSVSTVISRNGLDQIIQVQQGGMTRTNTYDSHYFLTQSTDPEVGTTIFGRDAVGNMTNKQVGSSPVTTYGYDGRNRLVSVTYPSGTPSVTHAYYLDDLVKSVGNGVALREYTYTANKKMSNEKLTVDSHVLSSAYTYDANDALQSAAYSTGLALTYNPDAFGRPTQAAPFATAVSFYPNGQLQGMQYANGTGVGLGQNNRLWPSTVGASNGSTSLYNLSYAYDGTGNVQTISGTPTIYGRTFGYDALDRLTNVTTSSVTGGLITYDSRSNILSQSIGTKQLTYQYDPSTDRLTTVNDVTASQTMNMTYDVYGNVTSNSRHQFTYDDASTMRCADCGTPNEVDYAYDGTGTRVSELKNSVTTYFMYGNGGSLLFEQDTNGVKREYGYVAGKNIAKKETH